MEESRIISLSSTWSTDHAANIANFLKVYPDATVAATPKAFAMNQNFFELDLEGKRLEIANGGTLEPWKTSVDLCICPHGALAGSHGYL